MYYRGMTSTHSRAAKGGQFGANGEWYEGGKFINTIPENAKRRKVASRGTGRKQIAPYVWEVCPEEKTRTIYSKFAGFEGCLLKNDLSGLSDQTVAYYGLDRTELADLMARFHAGERWL